MKQDSKKVLTFAFVVACFAALLGAAILSVIVDPVWRGNYFSVWEFGAGESGVDDYWCYDISANQLESRIRPYWHTFKCYNHACFMPSGDSLIIYDDVMTLTMSKDSPIITANINKFCYRDEYGREPSENWRNHYIFFGLAPTDNVTIYDKDGNITFQGGETTVHIDPPIAVAIYDGDVTVAVAYENAPEGADLQISGGIFSMRDSYCGPGDASYPLTVYYAVEKGSHPELAYDVYCMAFGGCTPTPQPELPATPEIDWNWLLFIIILVVVLLILLL